VYPGHTLVISKKQIEHFLDLPLGDYNALWATVRKLGPHIKRTMKKEFLGVGIKGTDIPHVHVHLMPFNKDEEKSDKEISVAPDEELKAVYERLKLTA
jgi:histidine triad (HIT) family protein